MKKSVQKLTLHRETLCQLADEQIQHAGARANAAGKPTGGDVITDSPHACL